LPENIRGLFYFLALLTAGFDGRSVCKIGRDLVGCEGLDVHFDQTDERTTVIRPLAAAAIDNDADPRNFSAVRADDIDGFLDAPAAGHHILGHNEPFVRPDLKTAPQGETAGFFFHEDMAFRERAPNFLADDDSTEGRGDDGVALDVAQLIGEPSANVRGDVGVLKEQGALEKLPAVKARPQNEMAVEQRSGLPKEREQIVAH
jgi:hypothetical protein